MQPLRRLRRALSRTIQVRRAPARCALAQRSINTSESVTRTNKDAFKNPGPDLRRGRRLAERSARACYDAAVFAPGTRVGPPSTASVGFRLARHPAAVQRREST